MKAGNYICELCGKEYEPTKRGIQRFCSRKCGKKHNYHKNKSIKELSKKTYKGFSKTPEEKKENGKIEEVTLPGVLQVTAGVLLADGVKGITKAFSNPKKQPVTVENIQELKSYTGSRYRPIKNYKLGPNGEQYYFDLETNQIVYIPKRKENNTVINQINTANNVV
ncbi:hypothetical protein ACFQ5N_02025 [Lutibacter holmesii]|uniref:Uncharacterized protein n=1 Tax=Lutibacter holmesii TaxID=1137985 RepID=A0ABW3WJX3_9FLAO